MTAPPPPLRENHLLEPVSETEARSIIERWGWLHDQQAGLSAFLPLIAAEGFYMQFGAKRWVGYADFEDHQITKRAFFDEQHEYLAIRVEPTPGSTTAWTTMRWTFRQRPERSPRSRLIKAVLEHTWEFRRDPDSLQPFMQGHVVDRFDYLEGFRPDDPLPADPHLDPSWGTRSVGSEPSS